MDLCVIAGSFGGEALAEGSTFEEPRPLPEEPRLLPTRFLLEQRPDPSSSRPDLSSSRQASRHAALTKLSPSSAPDKDLFASPSPSPAQALAPGTPSPVLSHLPSCSLATGEPSFGVDSRSPTAGASVFTLAVPAAVSFLRGSASDGRLPSALALATATGLRRDPCRARRGANKLAVLVKTRKEICPRDARSGRRRRPR